MSRLVGWLVVAGVVAWATLARPNPAAACVTSGLTPHAVDPAAQVTDHVAPKQPALSIVEIKRGQGPQRQSCGTSSASSCDDLGSIALTNLATDDMTPIDRIGYRFTLVAGTFPAGFTLPSGTVVVFVSDGQMWLHWEDGATDDQESIDFTLQIIAVDAAGNESAPQTLRIRDDQGGCRVAAGRGSSSPGGAAFVLCALLAAALRPRRGHLEPPTVQLPGS